MTTCKKITNVMNTRRDLFTTVFLEHCSCDTTFYDGLAGLIMLGKYHWESFSWLFFPACLQIPPSSMLSATSTDVQFNYSLASFMKLLKQAGAN